MSTYPPTWKDILMSINFKSILTEAGKSGLQQVIITAGFGLASAAITGMIESRMKPKDDTEEYEVTDAEVIDHEEPSESTEEE